MTQGSNDFALWVNKTNISDITKHPLVHTALTKGQIRIAIQRFGLSANNVTYALTGDSFGYWGFFPAVDTQSHQGENGAGDSVENGTEYAAQYGIVPLWGFAEVIESAHPDIPVGKRFFGYLPMASQWVMQADKVSSHGFTDVHDKRVSNSPVYDNYVYCDTDPQYDATREVWQANFRPLFLTSFALMQYIASETVETASTIVITSASSKTAIGTALLLNTLPHIRVVGLTSTANVNFVEDLECYDEVLTYDEVADMRYTTPVWILDFAGNKGLLQQLQEIFDHLHHTSLFIGVTDIEAQQNKPSGKLKGDVFFAPQHIKMLIKMWGHERFMSEYAQAWELVAKGIETHFKVTEFSGAAGIIEQYQRLLQRDVSPNELLFGAS